MQRIINVSRQHFVCVSCVDKDVFAEMCALPQKQQVCMVNLALRAEIMNVSYTNDIVQKSEG
jgi:hypothetical protein